ncbi:MAG TPA: hypothetical protein VF092_25050 [Longimicrobium sp.]
MPKKKIVLDPESLRLETFAPVEGRDGTRGTVRGHDDAPPTYEFCTWESYCYTKNTCC